MSSLVLAVQSYLLARSYHRSLSEDLALILPRIVGTLYSAIKATIASELVHCNGEIAKATLGVATDALKSFLATTFYTLYACVFVLKLGSSMHQRELIALGKHKHSFVEYVQH